MSVSGSNFIWKTTKLAIHSNKKLFKCLRDSLSLAFGSFFRLKSFFLNSDSEGKMEMFLKNLKKFLFFLQFLIFFTN